MLFVCFSVCYTGQLFILKAFLLVFVINSNMTKCAKIQIKIILCLIMFALFKAIIWYVHLYSIMKLLQ